MRLAHRSRCDTPPAMCSLRRSRRTPRLARPPGSLPLMTVHELSRADARRIAVRAQLLDGPRPVDLLETVRELTLLQADQTAAVAPNADLVLLSRLGSS